MASSSKSAVVPLQENVPVSIRRRADRALEFMAKDNNAAVERIMRNIAKLSRNAALYLQKLSDEALEKDDTRRAILYSELSVSLTPDDAAEISRHSNLLAAIFPPQDTVPGAVRKRADRVLTMIGTESDAIVNRQVQSLLKVSRHAVLYLQKLTNQALQDKDANRAIGYSRLVVKLCPTDEGELLRHVDLLVSHDRRGEACLVLRDAIPLVADPTALSRNLKRISPRGRKEMTEMLGKARKFVMQEDHVKAGEILSQTLEKFGPDDMLVSFLLQRCLSASPEGIERYLGPSDDTDLPALPDEMRVRALLFLTRFDEALTLVRSAAQGLRDMKGARDIASCLVGLHRYGLAIRYLRFCHRRWPRARATFQELFDLYMKLGHYTAAAQLLDNTTTEDPSFAEQMIAARVLLLCYSGAAQDALDLYEQKISNPEKYTHLNKILLRRLGGEAMTQQATQIENQIKDTSKAKIARHWQSYQMGQMMTELRLTQHLLGAQPNGAPLDAETSLEELHEKVRENPHSTVMAILYINRMLREQPDRLTFEGGGEKNAIPKRINLYWNTTPPPEQVQAYVESWAAAEGYEYRLYSRKNARKFLLENMGSDWVRALQMTRRPVEEADFIRLCLLAHEGGVWADADDFLYGRLSKLIPENAGLVVYREPVGGAIANNFMAARPDHPVFVAAASLVRDALLQRSSETVWLKSGPGMFSRVIGQYLATTDPKEIRKDLMLWDQAAVRQQISIHNRLYHKAKGTHWNSAQSKNALYQGIFDQALVDASRMAEGSD